MAGERARHVFLNERHAAVLTKTNATITDLGKTINIDSWGRTVSFLYEMMRSVPDTSFDERRNAGGKPSYQWYTKIKVACQNFRKALFDWRQCDEELDWGFDKICPNMTSRIKLLDSTACIERSQQSTTS